MRARLVGVCLGLLLPACTSTLGQRVVTPSTDTVVIRVKGGETPPNPPGRDCRDHTATYAVSLKTHELAWDFCFLDERNKRVLDASEVIALERALAQLETVESQHVCPNDAAEISVTTTGEKTREYHADLCWAKPPLVDGDTLARLLKTLAQLSEK